MYSALHIAEDMKKKAFHLLDTQKRGKGMVSVDANRLIDLCLAFEHAAKGDVENLEFSLKVQQEIINDARERLNHIAWLTVDNPESEVYKIASKHL